MRIRIVQAAPRPRAPEANVESTAEAVVAAASCDLVVFPELFVSGYQLDRLDELALPARSPLLDPLRDAAATAGTAVVVGFAERVADGVANSALCIDRSGRNCGVYRKTHLFGAERDTFVAGDELTPIEVDGSRVGVMICFDVEFPEVARTLALRGADLLVTVSANMTPYAREHALFAQARALENRLPHLYVNRVGSESGFDFVGESHVVTAEGTIVGRLDDEAGMLDEELDAAQTPQHLDYLRQLRCSLYSLEGGRSS